MTDSQHSEPDIEDRAANIRMTVDSIIDSGLDAMFERFDKLKKRGINDDDMIEALTYLGDIEILDKYAEWGDIDLREPDEKIPDTPVPDPGNSETNQLIAEQYAHTLNVQTALDAIVGQLKVEREKELYFRDDDLDDAMLDGPVNLVELARAVTKALGK